jgi:hypothetical protein
MLMCQFADTDKPAQAVLIGVIPGNNVTGYKPATVLIRAIGIIPIISKKPIRFISVIGQIREKLFR